MAHAGASLFRHFRAYQVFGANTDVGKTIFSTLLLRASSVPDERAWYLKPVSTGPDDEADVKHVKRYCKNVQTQNFYQFQDPVSPHLAVQGFAAVEDKTLLSQIASQIRANAQAGPGFMLVETAGGPHSPGPSGLSQAQLYRPLRLPVILVADSKLGGISTSVSAYESLKIRGYDIDGVAMFQNDRYQNHEYLQQYFRDQGVPLLSIPPTKYLFENVPRDGRDEENLQKFYAAAAMHDNTLDFLPTLYDKHQSRVTDILNMSEEAMDRVWWPFAQHTELSAQGLNVIDSAYGDYFQTLKRPATSAPDSSENLLQATVDGSASWWTQGLGHGDSSLMLAAANAAGRYGHVMFASGAHEPAIRLASNLLGMLQNDRLQKVFYSDNGSTAMEVGLKMALKAACDRYGWSPATDRVDILGFTNSYHGDTIGAMDMSEPSVYNEKVPWYSGKGFWFDPPTVKMRSGKWVVDKPTPELGPPTGLSSIQDVFDSARDTSPDAAAYEAYIQQTLQRLTRDEKRKFGALVMEPVVLGAGGMLLVDPLFQRTLVRVVRASASLFATGSTQVSKTDNLATTWTGLPVLADEVFTGLYRLGHPSACSLLRIEPDISAHAKLLTGGLLPLSITAASQSIYDAFLSDRKTEALLHGHSYTAHPVGCAVANTSLDRLRDLAHGDAWAGFKGDWACAPTSPLSLFKDALSNLSLRDAVPILPRDSTASPTAPLEIWSTWSQGFVRELSSAARVESVWALGSVLAIALRDPAGSGYTSQAAVGLRDGLLAGVDGSGWNIHCRVLGNVLYLMTSQVAAEEDVRAWEGRVRAGLGL